AIPEKNLVAGPSAEQVLGESAESNNHPRKITQEDTLLEEGTYFEKTLHHGSSHSLLYKTSRSPLRSVAAYPAMESHLETLSQLPREVNLIFKCSR
ncbi:Hypothetical predicted protein, partial [Podarcis lilfordi]